MFDLTPEIKLNSADQKTYRYLQAAVYLFALFFGIVVIVLILFPTQYYTFSFANPEAPKNNLTAPTDEKGQLKKIASLTKNDSLLFGANLPGQFSTARIKLSINPDSSEKVISGKVTAKKSFQAFLYQEGDPAGFMDGTLLKDNNNYYLISNQKLRKFKDAEIVSFLGYRKEAFQEVSENELRYNPQGEEITDTRNYPDGTIFEIDSNYYFLEGEKLNKFLSADAYKTRYSTTQAIPQEESFLRKYPVSDNWIGYADGSLLASGVSVFVVSGRYVMPIDNPETFETMGYAWDDVRPVSEADIFSYERTKLFNKKSVHPDGTIFVTDEESKYYRIKENQKHLLPSANIASSWSKKSPILVSEEGVKKTINCPLKENFTGTYSCEIPLADFNNLVGKYYQFALTLDSDTQLEELNVEFDNAITLSNTKNTVKQLLSKILSRYGI